MSDNPSPLVPLDPDDAFFRVGSKVSWYPNFARVYIPNSPYKKLLPGLEARKSSSTSGGSNSIYEETDLERSLRRTRKTIKDYVLCNPFDIFCTFTFKDDRQNVDRCKAKMSNWLKNFQKRYGKFDYIIVPEFHKDRQSIHFHALIRGFKGELKESVNKETGRRILQSKRQVYEIPSYTLGFTNVKKIDSERDSQTKVGFYLQKYITKNMPTFHGKNRYWVSQGLKKPTSEDNPEPWYMFVKPDREYITDYGVIWEFDSGKNPLADMFIEANRP